MKRRLPPRASAGIEHQAFIASRYQALPHLLPSASTVLLRIEHPMHRDAQRPNNPVDVVDVRRPDARRIIDIQTQCDVEPELTRHPIDDQEVEAVPAVAISTRRGCEPRPHATYGDSTRRYASTMSALESDVCAVFMPSKNE